MVPIYFPLLSPSKNISQSEAYGEAKDKFVPDTDDSKCTCVKDVD